MQSPIRSTVLFPAIPGPCFALTLEDVQAPGRQYIALFGHDRSKLEDVAADIAGQGHSKVRVVPIEIRDDGVASFTLERKPQ